MDRGRHAVVAALAAVNLVVRVHGAAELCRGEVRDHLVDVHVAAGRGAGLKDIDRKGVGELAGRELERRPLDRRSALGRQLAEFGVDALMIQAVVAVRTAGGSLKIWRAVHVADAQCFEIVSDFGGFLEAEARPQLEAVSRSGEP